MPTFSLLHWAIIAVPFALIAAAVAATVVGFGEVMAKDPDAVAQDPDPHSEKLIKFPRAYSGRDEPLQNSAAKPPDPVVDLDLHPDPVPSNPDPNPDAVAHARALLGYMQERYGGHFLQAGEVEAICYPQLLEARGWRGRPWGGRHGVGKFLTDMTGGKRQYRTWEDEDGKPQRLRAYWIPPATAAARKRA